MGTIDLGDKSMDPTQNYIPSKNFECQGCHRIFKIGGIRIKDKNPMCLECIKDHVEPTKKFTPTAAQLPPEVVELAKGIVFDAAAKFSELQPGFFLRFDGVFIYKKVPQSNKEAMKEALEAS